MKLATRQPLDNQLALDTLVPRQFVVACEGHNRSRDHSHSTSQRKISHEKTERFCPRAGGDLNKQIGE